jgi:hypothetical protein
VNRRDFLGTSVAGMASITGGGLNLNPQVRPDSLPSAIQALTPMTAGIVPITDDERRSRIAKAKRLMEEQKIDAIFMEGGTSSYSFVGMRWGQSERTFGVVMPAKGAIAGMCFSDEPMLAIPGEVRHSPGGRRLHRGGWPALLHEAEPRHRPAVRGLREGG